MNTNFTRWRLSCFLILTAASSLLLAQPSAIYAGGPVYNAREYLIDELRGSGFETVIVWTIHIETNGDLGFNGEFPLVRNGVYVGNESYPDFPADVRRLKEAPTSVRRVEFGLSGAGSGTFQAVRNFYESEGFGPGTTLYRNFAALREAVPGIDALNNDDESTYHAPSAVEFTKMLAGLGFRNAIVPYTRSAFWRTLVDEVNAAYPGNIDRNYLQCYAGGAFNDPCSATWNLGIPMYPGLWGGDGRDKPGAVGSRMKAWDDQCDIAGGFMWIYDDFDNSAAVAEYANAINNALGAGPNPDPNPQVVDHTDPVGTGIVTARAEINADESAGRAFDNLSAAGTQNGTWSKWLDDAGAPSAAEPSWVQIQLPGSVVVNTLAVTSGNDFPGRDPADFALQGSTDGSNWTTLGDWSGQTWAGRLERREFTTANTGGYNFYRLSIARNRGNVGLTQLAEVELIGPAGSTQPPSQGCTDCVDFGGSTMASYASQDAVGTSSVEDGGATMHLGDNTWKRSVGTYAITPNTVVEFDFKSSAEGQIHGLGFDEDNDLSSNRIFKVHGTQAWGLQDHDTYNGSGDYATYVIPVGAFYTGNAMSLVLVNDYDAGGGNDGFFKNVRIYESNSLTPRTSPGSHVEVLNESDDEQDVAGVNAVAYPNPFRDHVTVELPGEHVFSEAQLFSATG